MLSPSGSRLRVGAGGTASKREKISTIFDGEATSATRTFHRDDGSGGEARQRGPFGAMSYRAKQVRGSP